MAGDCGHILSSAPSHSVLFLLRHHREVFWVGGHSRFPSKSDPICWILSRSPPSSMTWSSRCRKFIPPSCWCPLSESGDSYCALYENRCWVPERLLTDGCGGCQGTQKSLLPPPSPGAWVAICKAPSLGTLNLRPFKVTDLCGGRREEARDTHQGCCGRRESRRLTQQSSLVR